MNNLEQNINSNSQEKIINNELTQEIAPVEVISEEDKKAKVELKAQKEKEDREQIQKIKEDILKQFDEVESIESQQILKNCIDAINGSGRQYDSENIMLFRINKELDSFEKLSEKGKKEVNELLINKIAEIMSERGNSKLGEKIFKGLTKLSEIDKETIDSLSKKEKIDSETEEWDLELAKRNEKLVNLNLLSQEDRPLIIKKVFDNLRNESNQKQYSAFNNLEYLLKEEYTDYFKEDIKKYLEDYIDKIFSNAEEKIKNNENPQRLLEIRHIVLKEMISDGLKKIADPKKEIDPILEMIDEGLLKIEKLSTELDLKDIH